MIAIVILFGLAVWAAVELALRLFGRRDAVGGGGTSA